MFGTIKNNDSSIKLSPNYNNRSFKVILSERIHQQKTENFNYIFNDEVLEEINKCKIISVRLKAIDSNDAIEKSIKIVHEIIGTLNFTKDSTKVSRFSFRKRGLLPVSEVLIAPHITVHTDDGKLVDDSIWHENWVGGPNSKLNEQKLIAWETKYKKIRRAINKSKWRDVCQKSMIWHYNAFSNPDLKNAFFEGWKLFEFVTGSQFEKSENQINRVASVFKNSDEMRITGKHLLLRRNAIAHGAGVTADESEELAFQILTFISPFLERLILNGFSFSTIEEFWEFLDLPIDQDARDQECREINRRLQLLKKASVFRGG